MNVVTISEEKTEDISWLKEAFLRKGFEKAPFINIAKVGLLTKKGKTRIIVGSINFRRYDAVFLKAGPALTQFIEPFLAELVEEDIYCQLKPESGYITSNKPFMYSVLNASGIPIQKTTIVPGVEVIEQALKGFSFPLLFKTFVGHEKMQHVIVDSERSLRSMAKSIKSGVDAVLLQEYLEGDLNYCIVIGSEILAITRKWDENKGEHAEKGLTTTLSEKDTRLAKRAARIVGADIATVRMIDGRIVDVNPMIDIQRFNKILGKELQDKVAQHYWDMLNR